MKNKNDKIMNAIKLLSELKVNDNSDITIVADTSYDEATMIATNDALLSFALKLLQWYATLNIDSKNDQFEFEKMDNLNAFSSNEIKHIFDEFGDVWPIEICVAEDNDTVKKIINLFK